MTQKEMFLNASWIECPEEAQAPIFRKNFNAVKGEKAEIVICGLGFFELKINGKIVSDELLVPNASNYSERNLSKFIYPISDKLSFRTYCVSYDISDFLETENTVSVMLGGGYYHQDMYFSEGDVSFGTPKLCFVIKKESGNVVSDSSVQCNKGYYSRCNLYYGEKCDLNKKPAGYEYPGYSGPDFTDSREIKAPETDFVFQFAPADTVSGVITDIKLIKDNGDIKIYDIGRNIAGRAVIRIEKANEKVKVRYAEQIEGHEYYGIHFDDEKYTCEYVSDGVRKEYTVNFGWQGFRYIEITGNAIPVRAEMIHSDIDVTSEFECDNEVINWLYNTYLHTQLCNMHAGVPSDCPHRERLGYTGDGQLCAEAAMLTLDSREFYRKWIDDILDCQCRESGHVEHTAPFMGGGGGPCGWGGAIIEVPYRYYKIFGDISMLKKTFSAMLRYLDYIDSRSENGLVCREEEGGWCLGDWLPPEPIRIPEAFVNTCLYIGFIKTVFEIASIIGKESEVRYLKPRLEKSEKMVDSAYYSFQQRAYCGDINGASSIALSAGLGNENVKNKVIEKYRELGTFDTGIVATDKLIGFLFDAGADDVAVSLLSARKFASFGYMMDNGATTLWENWNGDSSQNHPMFGAPVKYLFTKILGIEQAKESCGFDKVIIAPHISSLLNYAKGSIQTVNGKISVEYTKSEKEIVFKLFAAPGIDSRFTFNGNTVLFSGNKELKFSI